LHYARDQCVHIDIEVQNEVGNQRHAEEVTSPGRLRSHNRVAREGGVHVAVGDHDEPRLQRRKNFVLEAIGEIGGVKQAEGGHCQLMPGLGLFDGFVQQR
jgi:hypothetical protein